WIRQALHSAVQRQGRTVQVPLNRAADLTRVSRAQEVLRQKLSREPHDEEIAKVADLSIDVTRGLVALLQPVRSLDEPTMAGDGGARSARRWCWIAARTRTCCRAAWRATRAARRLPAPSRCLRRATVACSRSTSGSK